MRAIVPGMITDYPAGVACDKMTPNLGPMSSVSKSVPASLVVGNAAVIVKQL